MKDIKVGKYQRQAARHTTRIGSALLGAALGMPVGLPVGLYGFASSAVAAEGKLEFKAESKIDARSDARAAKTDSSSAASRDNSGEGKSAREREAAFGQPFVTVNGSAQSVAMAELLLREQLLRGASDGPELRNGVREALVGNALMEQEAKKAGLDKNPLLQAQMEMARQRVLINAWQQKVLADEKIGDAQVRSEYDKQVSRMAATDVRIRQVLVADEVGAKLLLEKARGGSSMEALAKEYSREPSAKNTGGLSDWINAADLLPVLGEAIKGVEKGKLVDRPVQSPNGWHVLMVEDVRAFKPLAFDEVKPQVLALLQQRALQDRMKNLREKARVQ